MVCVCFYVHIICVKSIINLLQCCIAYRVSWVPGLTLLDLQIN